VCLSAHYSIIAYPQGFGDNVMINLSEERILDFLDGRLATPDEEELLHTLAVSPERRQVMREHMKLRELTSTIARQDRFSVPQNVTSQLFNKLEEAGFTPPITPESILAGPQALAPQAMSMRFAGAAAVGAGTVATGLSAGWRFGAISLLTASVMSFVLGAGAYYVFGSTLGLKTHSQEMAALQHSSRNHVTPGLAQFAPVQNAIADATPVNGNASSGIVNHSVHNSQAVSNNISVAGVFPISPINNAGTVPSNPSIPNAGNNDMASNDYFTPIGYTAPKVDPYTLTTDRIGSLNSPAPIVPNAVPTPLANDRGTISMRYGGGQAPTSTSANMSSLNEFRFGMTEWDYVIFRASIGQLTTYERVAQISRSGATQGQIITPESGTPTASTLIGLESGVTLEPLGVPIDVLGGCMWDGSTFYGRASIMAHFEPWKMMEISAGFEALLYNHDLSGSFGKLENFNGTNSAVLSSSAMKSEMGGLIGPALEIGWHF
jgi:hypothetical protein